MAGAAHPRCCSQELSVIHRRRRRCCCPTTRSSETAAGGKSRPAWRTLSLSHEVVRAARPCCCCDGSSSTRIPLSLAKESDGSPPRAQAGWAALGAVARTDHRVGRVYSRVQGQQQVANERITAARMWRTKYTIETAKAPVPHKPARISFKTWLTRTDEQASVKRQTRA